MRSANSLNMPIVSGVFSFAGRGSIAHSVPKTVTIGAPDRHRDVALEAVHRRGRVSAEGPILGNMVDDHGLAARPDLLTDRGFDPQLATRLEPEINVIAHCAGDPTVLGHARHGGEPHAGGATDHIEDRRHRVDTGDRGERFFHVSWSHAAHSRPVCRTSTADIVERSPSVPTRYS